METPLIWLGIGLVLMAFEILLPGFVIFWFGAGGILTAILTWINILPTKQIQILVFGLSSLFFLCLWHFYLKKFFKKQVMEEDRDATLSQLKGKVIQKIEPGKPGKVELYAPYHSIKIWSAESSEELEEGTEIIVREADGIKLVVSKNLYKK